MYLVTKKETYNAMFKMKLSNWQMKTNSSSKRFIYLVAMKPITGTVLPFLTGLVAGQYVTWSQSVGSLSKVPLIHFTLQQECLYSVLSVNDGQKDKQRSPEHQISTVL